MREHDIEPIRGLPGDLPPGEAILWQGAPDARVFARSALGARWIGGYFALLVAWAMVGGTLLGAALTAGFGVLALGLVYGFAWMVARSTVYTITNRRVVLRIGVALSKCINLPLVKLSAADLRGLGAGYGDIALSLQGSSLLGYAMLWPHARPFRLAAPQPMLRALPDAAAVARILAKATAAIMPVQQRSETAAPAANTPRPALGVREATA
ncbi:photosynthetic complex assembly protein [Novosphingobium fuchskuhlense]|uniref:Photosynthetic complex assembly protein n=1 Tax=Novosphingobium fuchskuhlense TaxID=1117702 RepID=A0A117UVM8_9SPHN|nr:photosynthetic complex putative assembly protein PuhB [Novosphingobium fuchskuhlense]KUR71691.1 photosynthetic complex assembly protein [Novosphingobium fuchskuhlense]